MPTTERTQLDQEEKTEKSVDPEEQEEAQRTVWCGPNTQYKEQKINTHVVITINVNRLNSEQIEMVR